MIAFVALVLAAAGRACWRCKRLTLDGFWQNAPDEWKPRRVLGWRCRDISDCHRIWLALRRARRAAAGGGMR